MARRRSRRSHASRTTPSSATCGCRVWTAPSFCARSSALQPATVRIVLSGYAEIESVARAATVAHRFLSKPCDVDELVSVIGRSCAINALVEQDELRDAASGTGRAAERAAAVLRADDADARPGRQHRRRRATRRAGRRDDGEGAAARELRVLRPRAGRSQTSSEAISYLGLNTLKALALSADAMEAFVAHAPDPPASRSSACRRTPRSPRGSRAGSCRPAATATARSPRR